MDICVPISSASRPQYTCFAQCAHIQGELHINEDLDVFEITKERITRRRWLVPERSWGFW